MERRLKERKRARVNVYLSCPGQGLRRCKASNLSANGAFVETDSFIVPKGTAVELVFVLNHSNVIRIYRMPATVARISKTGAGLMLFGRRAGSRGS